jgi:hypothetical protein
VKRGKPLERRTELVRTEMKRVRATSAQRNGIGVPVRLKSCAQCGEAFAPERPERKYCSRTCTHLAARGQRMRGRALNCAECGQPFYAKDSQLGRGRKYCSRACYFARSRKSPEATAQQNAKLSAARRGAGNPMWKGRDTEGSIYRVFNVRLKGETCCRACGATDVLHLHHAVPRSMCKAARRELRNGITLCIRCHMGWHHRRVVIYRDLFTADEWAYISTLDLRGQRIEAWLDDRYPARPVQ